LDEEGKEAEGGKEGEKEVDVDGKLDEGGEDEEAGEVQDLKGDSNDFFDGWRRFQLTSFFRFPE
jgi:hypothetical protein